MIAFLDVHVATPGLFRQRVPADAMAIVRRCLEREEGIPTTIGTISNTAFTVHAVAQVTDGSLPPWVYFLLEVDCSYQYPSPYMQLLLSLSLPLLMYNIH